MPEGQLDQYSLARLPIDSLPASDQVTIVRNAVSEHLQTLENRIDRARLGGVAADVARFYALFDLCGEVSDVWQVMGWKALSGTGMLGTGEFNQAVNQGLGAANDFISSLRAAMQFSPDRPQKIALEDLSDVMEQEMLRFAYDSSERILERFSGLQKVMQEKANYPDSEWRDWVTQYNIKGKARKMPEGLGMVMEFIRHVWIWKRLDEKGVPREKWLHNPYNEANLKKYPAMDTIRDYFLTPKEQAAVKQVINYGGGPNFIRESTLM